MSQPIKKMWAKGKKILIPLLILLAFLLGYLLKPTPPGLPSSVEAPAPQDKGEIQPTIWTCSMHPQIKLPEPGQCPICGMDLVPVKELEEEVTDKHPRRLTMSEAAKALAEIKTAPVVRKSVVKTTMMVGKVEYDEGRVFHITAWVPGRIDRLYFNFTGVQVEKGAPMVYIYSPELLSSQQEYLQALKIKEDLDKSSDSLSKEMAIATLRSTEEKLRLLGLSPEQIAEIQKNGKAADHITIYSPSAGTVIQKNGFEGMYVNTGTRIYTIADLSHVWGFLDAYESDLIWIHYGQEVEFTAEAYPGERFTGRIAFIEPYLNEKTRTVKLRVNVPNTDGRLKPGMFVHGMIKAHVLKDGKVFSPELAGKWICPMHPDVIKDKPGECSLCGMELVPTETLGYAVKVKHADMPLVIPAGAPLITGKRAVVYIEVPDAKQPTYEGRVTELGHRAGEYYIVKSGLKEGERVVVEGNFKIDSALQIQAKQSMMSEEEGERKPPAAHVHVH
ncbi:MAG: efflux RND transporter periplasmic adaptor subunit [Acidobacteriota bacterium]